MLEYVCQSFFIIVAETEINLHVELITLDNGNNKVLAPPLARKLANEYTNIVW